MASSMAGKKGITLDQQTEVIAVAPAEQERWCGVGHGLTLPNARVTGKPNLHGLSAKIGANPLSCSLVCIREPLILRHCEDDLTRSVR